MFSRHRLFLFLFCLSLTPWSHAEEPNDLAYEMRFTPFLLTQAMEPFLQQHYHDPFAIAVARHVVRYYNALAWDYQYKLTPETKQHLRQARQQTEHCLQLAAPLLTQYHAREFTLPSHAQRVAINRTKQTIIEQFYAQLTPALVLRVEHNAGLSEQVTPSDKRNTLLTEKQCLSKRPLPSVGWLADSVTLISDPL